MSNHTSRLRSADSLEFLADVSRGHGAVIALDAVTGEQKWKFGMTDVTSSGILTTASDLLFTGAREGYFQALDPPDGQRLWKASLGGQIVNGPITHKVVGKQYVATSPGTRSWPSRSAIDDDGVIPIPIPRDCAGVE